MNFSQVQMICIANLHDCCKCIFYTVLFFYISPAEIVSSNPTRSMDVCMLCVFVLSGRGLCDELITRPEESYRLWCVVVYNLENLKNEEAMTRVGSQRHSKKKYIFSIYLYVL
jgi:hypothetical protein